LVQDLYAKISEQNALLLDIKRAVEDKHTSAPRRKLLSGASTAVVASPSPEQDQQVTQSPADNNTETAPVVMIRNIFRRAHGGSERLKNHGIQELVALGPFSHSVVIDLMDM